MSELDLDDAIASILADSDEDAGTKKKKPSSKKKNSKLLSSKALTSSVNDEEFYKNLSKISEEQENEKQEDIKVTEEDAKKMAGNLAGLDDLDSDLLGSLGRKKVASPKERAGKDAEIEKHEERRRTSSGSLHRKGSVTPFSDEEIGVLDNNLMISEEEDDVLNSSMNSSTSKHRKVSPNKISPRVSLENMPEDTKGKKPVGKKKSKEIDFDSDSELPGLDSKDTTDIKRKKKPSSRGRKSKKTADEDLFGDDDDLPDLDCPTKSEKPKAASALDNLMGKKSKSSTSDRKKSKPASLDDFMAKVSTSSKTPSKSEIQSPVRSPTSEETFQFGGYMPSSAGGRSSSRSARPDSDFGRRSVKFSDDLGLGDDLFSSRKRPSTAPSGRRKNEETKDPLNNTFTPSSSKDKGDWLGLDEKTDSPREDEDLQTSLQGSKTSTSGDWLGLGDDVADDQLNDGLTKSLDSDTQEPSSTAPALAKTPQAKKDDELSKMLDLVPDEQKVESDDKSLFPWEGGKGRRGRRTPKEDQTEVLSPKTDSEAKTDKTLDKTIDKPKTSTPTDTSSSNQNEPTREEIRISNIHSLPSSQQPGRVSDPVSSDRTPQPNHVRSAADDPGHVNSQRTGSNAPRYRSEINKENFGVELKEMIGKIQDVENEKYKVEMDMANKLAELETKIRRLEVENDSLKQSLELNKERNKEEISAIQNSHRNRVEALEESYQRREAREREETENLISKHKDTVNQLERERADLKAAHARKISSLESNRLAEVERLTETHRRVLDELRSEHNAEINHLKRMKEEEISATMKAFAHTKSLQGLMQQVSNSTKQIEDMHHLVELSYKTSQQERDITIKNKDEYLSQLQERILKQQTENDEERTRLQNLVAKMEIQMREQSRKYEEDKWKLTQEDSRLKSLRMSLEEERRITREQLEAERGLVQRTKEEFLSQQRQTMADMNEERRTLALERAEVNSAQRGMINKEKLKHDNFTKFDAEQESARVRLAEDTAALNAREEQLRRDQEEFRREKRIFMDKQDKWNTEKDRIGRLGLELEKRAQEIDEISLEAAKVGEDGRNSLELAQRMQVEISQQSNEVETRVLLLQEKERQIADERLAVLKEKRELEMERRRGLCARCSRGALLQSDSKRAPESTRAIHSSDSNLSSHFITTEELVSSPLPPRTSPSLAPDLLANTLDLKRTLRRCSLDKEQDEEFLAKESEFLNNLQDLRLRPVHGT
ncbi:fas-binding factor 1 homolog [Dendronephthya gigantea]|uniref:fas-binding factor 1 homolog n=1 Tax=Dendronephthya gigantea TaxID=151771 RepID=UPI00106CA1A3|nr:fas-binding factor 1 homolog [Dendronephthya gigantea]XP_028417314.1 fas-binding factor 1 homolog [Dendronephthya gigantea]XP_028417315.1 fas-binding factor 1 homolog [Dendronephthya gigantea]